MLTRQISLSEVSTGFSDSMPDYGGSAVVLSSFSAALKAILKILDIFIIVPKAPSRVLAIDK